MQEVNSVVLINVESQTLVSSPAANRESSSLSWLIIDYKRAILRVFPNLRFDGVRVQIKVGSFFSEVAISEIKNKGKLNLRSTRMSST